MPEAKVNFRHPEYQASIAKWERCRDVIKGEDAVKAAGTRYLPELQGQDGQEYAAYKTRATFYGATKRTVYGLTGAIFRRPPRVEVPEKMTQWLRTAGSDGCAFHELAKRTVQEDIGIGRGGLLVDASPEENSQPYLAVYLAESIINWRTAMVKGREVLTLVVLRECEEVEEGEFGMREDETYRVLSLDLSGSVPVYSVTVWRKVKGGSASTAEFAPGDPIFPRFWGGKPIDFIPFTFINPESTDDDVSDPPLLDLVDMNLSHYRTYADLEHGCHYTALPTPWVAGFDPKTTQLKIGAGVAWVSDNPDAKCGMLEFSGAGLGALREHLQGKERQMAVLGSRMLEEQKAGVEAASTVALRQSGEACILTFIARSVSEALSRTLRWAALWMGYATDPADEEIEVELNEDFGLRGLDSATLTALMTYVQSNFLSWDSLFVLLQADGLIPEERTIEEERELIQAGLPVTPPAPPGLPGDPNAPDVPPGDGGNAPQDAPPPPGNKPSTSTPPGDSGGSED